MKRKKEWIDIQPCKETRCPDFDACTLLHSEGQLDKCTLEELIYRSVITREREFNGKGIPMENSVRES
jgi:hypothetical protein